MLAGGADELAEPTRRGNDGAEPLVHIPLEVSYWADGGGAAGAYVGGYFNTTAAITAVQFKMSSGNIESGTIKLYGVS